MAKRMVAKKDRTVYRRTTVNDVSVLVSLRVRFLNELLSHPEDDETALVRKSLQEYFAKAMPRNDFVAWVAERGGKVIATSGMVVWEKPAIYGGVESGRLGYLLDFYTVPEARGEGITTQLLSEIIKEAKSMGLHYFIFTPPKTESTSTEKQGSPKRPCQNSNWKSDKTVSLM